MSLISKEHLNLSIQAIKKLIERIESRFLDELDAIEISAEMGLVVPLAADDNAIYTDENGDIYIL